MASMQLNTLSEDTSATNSEKAWRVDRSVAAATVPARLAYLRTLRPSRRRDPRGIALEDWHYYFRAASEHSSPSRFADAYITANSWVRAFWGGHPHKFIALYEALPMTCSFKTSEEKSSSGMEDVQFTSEFLASFSQALSKLLRIISLAPNWDSHGAPTVSRASVASAILLLRELSATIPALPSPLVSPSPSGNVTLQWRVGQNEIWVEAGIEEHSFYVAAAGRPEVIQEGDFSNVKLLASQILPFLRPATP
jgi:hypothetical protein